MDSHAPPIDAGGLDRHAAFIRQLARSLLADEHMAEDLAQDTWVRWMEKPPRHTRGLSSWLRTVARNLAVNGDRTRRRRLRREELAAQDEALPSTIEQVAERAVLRSVVDAVTALEEPYQSAIWMRYFRGMGVAAIAAQAGVAEATVRSRVQRALAQLRETLEREHGTRGKWTAALAVLTPSAGPHVAPHAGAFAFGAWKLASGLAVVLLGAGGVLWIKSSPPVSPSPPATVTVAPEASRGPSSGTTVPPEDGPELARSAAAQERVGVAQPVTSDEICVRGSVSSLGYARLQLVAGPAANTTLRVYRDERDLWRGKGDPERAPLELSSDESGNFEVRFDDPGTRPLTILVGSAGDELYRAARATATLADGEHLVEGLGVVRVPHGLILGDAVDLRGEPLAGVIVALRSASSSTSPITAISGADGRFLLQPEDHYTRIDAMLADYSLLDAPPLMALETGGWRPVHLVLAPAASVEITVVDTSGAPLEGIDVRVQPADDELPLLSVSGGFGSQPRTLQEKTDAQGKALLEGVWARTKIAVETGKGWRQKIKADAVLDGVLVLERERGTPIVLAPGELRELIVEWRRAPTIAARVVHADGSPAEKPTYRILDLGAESELRNHVLAEGQGRADGTISVPLRAPTLVGPVRVIATHRAGAKSEGEGLSALGYAGPARPTESAWTEMRAVYDFDPRTLESDRVEIELVLEPTFMIAGEVVAQDGVRLDLTRSRHRVWALPAGQSDPYQDRSAGAEAKHAEDGGFLIEGLRAGAYDLFVADTTRSFYTFTAAIHRFPDIPAGASGVRLELPEIRTVNITISASGAEAVQWTVLHGALTPRTGGALPANDAPRTQRIERLDGWPTNAPLNFHGATAGPEPAGRAEIGLYNHSPQTHTLPPLAPGWYRIGLHGHGEGTGLFPMATAWQYFTAGDHAIEFVLRPTTSARGQLDYDGPPRFWAVSLIDDEGRALPLRPNFRYAEPSTEIGIGTSGAVELAEVPVGRFRLRLGTRAQLERGEFEREQEVLFEEGIEAALEL